MNAEHLNPEWLTYECAKEDLCPQALCFWKHSQLYEGTKNVEKHP